MFRGRYEELQTQCWQSYCRSQKNQAPLLLPDIMLAHKKKGVTGKLVDASANKISIASNGKAIRAHYSMFSEVDALGTPLEDTVKDMTGRPINISDWISYSTRYGHSGHTLAMGQVLRISESGQLTVVETVRDGSARKQSREVLVRDPDQALLLPMAEDDLVIFRLTDFKRFDD